MSANGAIYFDRAQKIDSGKLVSAPQEFEEYRIPFLLSEERKMDWSIAQPIARTLIEDNIKEAILTPVADWATEKYGDTLIRIETYVEFHPETIIRVRSFLQSNTAVEALKRIVEAKKTERVEKEKEKNWTSWRDYMDGVAEENRKRERDEDAQFWKDYKNHKEDK